MTETAVIEAPSPEPTEHVMTWRNAVTPVSRASRRRWTAVYPVLLTGGGVSVAAPHLLGLNEETGVAWGFLIAMAVVFGMLRRGTRRLTAFDHPDLDERDASARAGAMVAAYHLLLPVLILSVVALFVVLPDVDRTTRELDPGGNVLMSTESGFFLTAEALIGSLLWGFFWVVFLPTGVLAWREPDALEPETVTRARGVSEPVRDALLATALAVGMAATLVDDNGFWVLLALLLVLMALGAVARHNAGQPAMSAMTKANLGVVFLVLGAAVAALAVSEGPLPWLAAALMLGAGVVLIALAYKGRSTAP